MPSSSRRLDVRLASVTIQKSSSRVKNAIWITERLARFVIYAWHHSQSKISVLALPHGNIAGVAMWQRALHELARHKRPFDVVGVLANIGSGFNELSSRSCQRNALCYDIQVIGDE